MCAHTKREILRIVIVPSDGRSPCEVCTGTQHCCCLLWGKGGCLTHKYLWGLYNHNKMYIHVSCKIFQTSNVNVLTKEAHAISISYKNKSKLYGFIFPWVLGFWCYITDVLTLQTTGLDFIKNLFAPSISYLRILLC